MNSTLGAEADGEHDTAGLVKAAGGDLAIVFDSLGISEGWLIRGCIRCVRSRAFLQLPRMWRSLLPRRRLQSTKPGQNPNGGCVCCVHRS
jgi:hypothetical protein